MVTLQCSLAGLYQAVKKKGPMSGCLHFQFRGSGRFHSRVDQKINAQVFRLMHIIFKVSCFPYVAMVW